ncbi:MAG: ATP-grasp domain-containing protein, partial [Betaproteobacteria bacterium]|nr:ATP-grasp domain-containing protein [Betaproteobacteria bacterium]
MMRRGDLAPRWHRYETLVAPGDWERSWREVLLWADVVWLTAPEAEGDLLRLSREVEAAGCALLGPSSEAVAVAGSKRATHAALLGRIAQAEVRAVDAEGEWSSATGWVLKPDLGAGGVGVRRIADDALGALRDRLTADSVLQPFVEGEPLSLSVLSHAGEARVVSVNRQRIEWDEAGFARYRGGIANALPERERFQPMADAVQAAIPGLKGYWGIDCVLPAEGEPVLIEVNPRPTTSRVRQSPCALWRGIDQLEAGLREATTDWPVAPSRVRHAATMTGELVDAFPDRRTGVEAIIGCATTVFAPAAWTWFGLDGRLLDTATALADPLQLASANWLATANCAAQQGDGLLIDIGSTTTDIVVLHDGRAQPLALTDGDRLAVHELVYRGIVRTPVMALAHH